MEQNKFSSDWPSKNEKNTLKMRKLKSWKQG